MTDTKEKDRTFWAETVAGIKKLISKKEDDLDAAGIDKKAIDIMPETVDALRNNLCEAFPAMCEGEGEAVSEVMQVIVDTMAEAQPATDVEEEAADSEEEDKDEDEKDSEVVELAQRVTEMGKAYNELIEGVSDVIKVVHKALEVSAADKKSYTDYGKELAEIKKMMGERPRRASQAPETELDPDSELAKSLKNRDMSDIPDAFADMFTEAS